MVPLKGSESAPGQAIGAYGLALRGMEAARSLLVPAEPDWPSFELVRRRGYGSGDMLDRVSESSAELQIQNGGQIHIDRRAGRATFMTPRPTRIEELVHPYLARVAAVTAYWLERESFHAGALVSDGGVWGLLGERTSGKSSMLAWLALQGLEIVSDDMLILSDGHVFAGPRSLDLRGDAAASLGAGEPLGVAGGRERWRIKLGPVGEGLPLRGWIFLSWGADLAMQRLTASERIARLATHRGVRLPPRNAALLDLAMQPGWELTRPRGWDVLGRSAELLLETIRD